MPLNQALVDAIKDLARFDEGAFAALVDTATQENGGINAIAEDGVGYIGLLLTAATTKGQEKNELLAKRQMLQILHKAGANLNSIVDGKTKQSIVSYALSTERWNKRSVDAEIVKVIFNALDATVGILDVNCLGFSDATLALFIGCFPAERVEAQAPLYDRLVAQREQNATQNRLYQEILTACADKADFEAIEGLIQQLPNMAPDAKMGYAGGMLKFLSALVKKNYGSVIAALWAAKKVPLQSGNGGDLWASLMKEAIEMGAVEALSAVSVFNNAAADFNIKHALEKNPAMVPVLIGLDKQKDRRPYTDASQRTLEVLLPPNLQPALAEKGVTALQKAVVANDVDAIHAADTDSMQAYIGFGATKKMTIFDYAVKNKGLAVIRALIDKLQEDNAISVGLQNFSGKSVDECEAILSCFPEIRNSRQQTLYDYCNWEFQLAKYHAYILTITDETAPASIGEWLQKNIVSRASWLTSAILSDLISKKNIPMIAALLAQDNISSSFNFKAYAEAWKTLDVDMGKALFATPVFHFPVDATYADKLDAAALTKLFSLFSEPLVVGSSQDKMFVLLAARAKILNAPNMVVQVPGLKKVGYLEYLLHSAIASVGDMAVEGAKEALREKIQVIISPAKFSIDAIDAGIRALDMQQFGAQTAKDCLSEQQKICQDVQNGILALCQQNSGMDQISIEIARLPSVRDDENNSENKDVLGFLKQLCAGNHGAVIAALWKEKKIPLKAGGGWAVWTPLMKEAIETGAVEVLRALSAVYSNSAQDYLIAHALEKNPAIVPVLIGLDRQKDRKPYTDANQRALDVLLPANLQPALAEKGITALQNAVISGDVGAAVAAIQAGAHLNQAFIGFQEQGSVFDYALNNASLEMCAALIETLSNDSLYSISHRLSLCDRFKDSAQFEELLAFFPAECNPTQVFVRDILTRLRLRSEFLELLRAAAIGQAEIFEKIRTIRASAILHGKTAILGTLIGDVLDAQKEQDVPLLQLAFDVDYVTVDRVLQANPNAWSDQCFDSEETVLVYECKTSETNDRLRLALLSNRDTLFSPYEGGTVFSYYLKSRPGSYNISRVLEILNVDMLVKPIHDDVSVLEWVLLEMAQDGKSDLKQAIHYPFIKGMKPDAIQALQDKNAALGSLVRFYNAVFNGRASEDVKMYFEGVPSGVALSTLYEFHEYTKYLLLPDYRDQFVAFVGAGMIAMDQVDATTTDEVARYFVDKGNINALALLQKKRPLYNVVAAALEMDNVNVAKALLRHMRPDLDEGSLSLAVELRSKRRDLEGLRRVVQGDEAMFVHAEIIRALSDGDEYACFLIDAIFEHRAGLFLGVGHDTNAYEVLLNAILSSDKISDAVKLHLIGKVCEGNIEWLHHTGHVGLQTSEKIFENLEQFVKPTASAAVQARLAQIRATWGPDVPLQLRMFARQQQVPLSTDPAQALVDTGIATDDDSLDIPPAGLSETAEPLEHVVQSGEVDDRTRALVDTGIATDDDSLDIPPAGLSEAAQALVRAVQLGNVAQAQEYANAGMSLRDLRAARASILGWRATQDSDALPETYAAALTAVSTRIVLQNDDADADADAESVHTLQDEEHNLEPEIAVAVGPFKKIAVGALGALTAVVTAPWWLLRAGAKLASRLGAPGLNDWMVGRETAVFGWFHEKWTGQPVDVGNPPILEQNVESSTVSLHAEQEGNNEEQPGARPNSRLSGAPDDDLTAGTGGEPAKRFRVGSQGSRH